MSRHSAVTRESEEPIGPSGNLSCLTDGFLIVSDNGYRNGGSGDYLQRTLDDEKYRIGSKGTISCFGF